jgi:hypothetical protein
MTRENPQPSIFYCADCGAQVQFVGDKELIELFCPNELCANNQGVVGVTGENIPDWLLQMGMLCQDTQFEMVLINSKKEPKLCKCVASCVPMYFTPDEMTPDKVLTGLNAWKFEAFALNEAVQSSELHNNLYQSAIRFVYENFGSFITVNSDGKLFQMVVRNDEAQLVPYPGQYKMFSILNHVKAMEEANKPKEEEAPAESALTC